MRDLRSTLSRIVTATLMATMAVKAPAQTAASFDDAVRANLALGVELCLRHLPQVDALRANLAAAGFTYTVEDYGAGERIHWYTAPADTAAIAVSEGQMAPDCRVTTSHMGATDAVAFTGAVLQQRFAALNFQYGNMENTPPVTAANMGGRWEFCTGYVGWNGQRPITLAVANDGNDPACIDDGTAQIVIAK